MILLAASLFMSLKTSFSSYCFLFWILLTVPTVSFLWLMLAYFSRKISLVRKITLRIEEDDFLDIVLEVKNKSFLPIFDLVLEDYLSCAQASEKKKIIMLDSLKLNSISRLVYRCLCPQRGKYDLGPLTAYFFDPLGLIYFKEKYPVYSELYVYPRTFNIRKFPALNKGSAPWLGVETSRVSGDDDDFFGVREYRRGDPIKKVHWMASARKSQLIVKEFQRHSFFRATIMFNLEKENNFGEGKESVAEYTIKIVASIARYLTNLGISFEIISHAGEVVHIPFNKGVEHLDEVLKFLTIAQPESRVTLLELFETFNRNILEDSSLIVVMPDENKAFLPTMLSLEVKNVSIIPIFLISSTFAANYSGVKNTEDYGFNISANAKVNPIYISCQDNLEEKF